MQNTDTNNKKNSLSLHETANMCVGKFKAMTTVLLVHTYIGISLVIATVMSQTISK